MGDSVVLIQNKSGRTCAEVEIEMEEWLKYWFVWHRLWREKDVCHRLKCWTRWIGVPLHAWNERFFKIASSKIGAFVRLDHRTKKRSRLDCARVLVYVPFMNYMNISFTVVIDGR
ncbi:hypothetical protein ACS0TY_030694 [Phlomoides rotata]